MSLLYNFCIISKWEQYGDLTKHKILYQYNKTISKAFQYIACYHIRASVYVMEGIFLLELAPFKK